MAGYTHWPAQVCDMIHSLYWTRNAMIAGTCRQVACSACICTQKPGALLPVQAVCCGVVFAKMAGYARWPAQVCNSKHQSRKMNAKVPYTGIAAFICCLHALLALRIKSLRCQSSAKHVSQTPRFCIELQILSIDRLCGHLYSKSLCLGVQKTQQCCLTTGTYTLNAQPALYDAFAM